MKVIVANQDRSQALGAEIAAAAGARDGADHPRLLSPQHSALMLRDASSEADYQSRLIKLLRIRMGIRTDPFPMPGRPGALGGLMQRVRAFLWRLLRYQHDRIALQQNAVNDQLMSAIEFEHGVVHQRLQRLEERIDAMDARAEGTP